MFLFPGEIRVSEERFNEFLEACNLLQLKSMINYDYASRFEGDDTEQTQLGYQESQLEGEDAMQVQIIGDYSDSEYQIVSQRDQNEMSGFEIEVIEQSGIGVGGSVNLGGNLISQTSTPYESRKRKRPLPTREPVKQPTPGIKRERILKEDDPEYAENLKKAKDEVILNKVSFQVASTKYNISKTHLWRVCQSTPEYHLQRESSLNPELNAVIIDALKSGETLLSISKKYNVPVSTLHRRKSMLYEQGELPENVRIKQRNRGEDFGVRLEMAIGDITTLGISQTEAAKKYRIPKTTIWRRLKKMSGTDPNLRQLIKSEGIKLEDDQMAFELITSPTIDYQQADGADEIIVSESIEGEDQEIVAVGEEGNSVADNVEMIVDADGEPSMKYIKIQNESDLHSEMQLDS